MGKPSVPQMTRSKRKRTDDDRDDEEAVKSGMDGEETGTSDGSEDSDDDDDDCSTSDEDSDKDGDSTGVIEHHEDSEGFPHRVAYDQAFKDIVTELTGIAKRALKIFHESQCTSKRVRGCTAHAAELSQFPKSKREKVALLGNTGAGTWVYPELCTSFLTSCREKLAIKLFARSP